MTQAGLELRLSRCGDVEDEYAVMLWWIEWVAAGDFVGEESDEDMPLAHVLEMARMIIDALEPGKDHAYGKSILEDRDEV
jgi:hypothetical protein